MLQCPSDGELIVAYSYNYSSTREQSKSNFNLEYSTHRVKIGGLENEKPRMSIGGFGYVLVCGSVYLGGDS